MTVTDPAPPLHLPRQATSPDRTEHEQYHQFSARIERIYTVAAHSVNIDSHLNSTVLTLSLSVLNRSGYVLSPKDRSDLTDLVEQAGELLGPGHWLLENKKAKHNKSAVPRAGWKKHETTPDTGD